tara:strand:- start:79855 stop:80886 length:1032 start_codon:yes stop_codon:yes gene_type:complete
MFLLILVLAGGGGWFGYQQWLAQQRYEQTFVQLQSDNAALRQQLHQAQAAIDDAQESQQQALTEMEAAGQRDEQRISRLQQQLGRDMQDVTGLVETLQGEVANLQQRDVRWLNAEANYLMRLAQRKLVMEADVTSTLLLLNTVNELLAQQDSLLATTAQQSLAMDMQTLRNLRLPNRVAISEQLLDLGARLQQLSFSASRQEAYEESVQQRLQQGVAGTVSQDWMTAALDLLRTVFVWREVDPTQPVILQPDQELLLKQQMLLQLEQARLAVVQGDPEMFDMALRQLYSVLDRFAGQGNQRADVLLAEIETMRGTEITAQLPDLATSISLIRQLAAVSAARVE